MQLLDFTERAGLVVGDDLLLSFEIFQDDLKVREATEADLPSEFAVGVVYVSGTPEDVATWTWTWEVRRKDNSTGEPLLIKITGDGVVVTGTYNAAHVSNTQRVEITIPDTDTAIDDQTIVVPAGKYRYSLKRADAGAEKTVAHGQFVLLELPVRV